MRKKSLEDKTAKKKCFTKLNEGLTQNLWNCHYYKQDKRKEQLEISWSPEIKKF